MATQEVQRPTRGAADHRRQSHCKIRQRIASGKGCGLRPLDHQRSMSGQATLQHRQGLPMAIH